MEIWQNITHLWLIAGGLLIIFEFILLPGVGLLFAGFGALTTGALLVFGFELGVVWQWIIFFAGTVIWAATLWKPFSKFRSAGEDEKKFTDMVGAKAVLITGLNPGEIGQARWSGTIMKTRLDDGHHKTLPAGSEVTILRVEGNILIVVK